MPMEMLDINNEGGQGYGYILYRANIPSGNRLILQGHVRDYAVVSTEIILLPEPY